MVKFGSGADQNFYEKYNQIQIKKFFTPQGLVIRFCLQPCMSEVDLL